jgi:hypothetical protein
VQAEWEPDELIDYPEEVTPSAVSQPALLRFENPGVPFAPPT